MNFQEEIIELLPKIETGGSSIDEAIYEAFLAVCEASKADHKLYFIGNGGSAAIAQHMAADWTKAGSVPSVSFTNISALTAIGNDIGFDQVFSYQLQRFGMAGDILFAISSSGQSPDILQGAAMAYIREMKVITFSGFEPSNPLRSMGFINFYVPSHDYGLVECSHLILNHAILNAMIGLRNV